MEEFLSVDDIKNLSRGRGLFEGGGLIQGLTVLDYLLWLRQRGLSVAIAFVVCPRYCLHTLFTTVRCHMVKY